MTLSAPPPPSERNKPRELSVKRRTQAGFICALICLGAMGAVSYFSVNRLRDAAAWSQHTQVVIASLRLLQQHLADTENTAWAYRATAESHYRDDYHSARQAAQADVAALRALVADNPAQLRRLEATAALIQTLGARLDREVNGPVDPAFLATSSGTVRAAHLQIRQTGDDMEHAEQDLLHEREKAARGLRITEKEMIIGGSVLALAVIALALSTVGRDFARRRATSTQAGQAGKAGRLGAWSVKLPERTLVWSDEVCAIHEVPLQSRPTFASAVNFYPPGSRAILVEAFEACQRTGSPFDLELQIVTAKGNPLWVRVIGEAERDPKGTIRRIHGITQDVSERTRQGEAVQRQQAELRVLFDLIPAMVWFKDTENRVLRVNRLAAECLGRPVDEVEGCTTEELYPKDAAQFWADDQDVMRSGESKLGIIEPMTVRPGKQLWVQTDKVPVRDREGKVVGIVVMAQDVTARRQAEVDLKYDQSLLRMAGRLTRLGAWEIAWPGHTVRWSDETCAIYEEPPGFAPTFSEMIKYFAPAAQGTIRAAVEACGQNATPFDVELPIVTTTGRSSWVRAIGEAARDAGGAIQRVQGAFQDIAERKAAEESLRLLNSAALQSTESIMITDAQLDPPGPRIVFVNPAFSLMTGYPADEILGRSPRFLQGPQTDRAVLDRLRKNLEQGEIFHGNAINYRKDGTEFTLEWRITPIRDANGKTSHFLAIQRDISAHLREVEALRKSEEQFRQVVENIREVFWIWDTARNAMVYISPAYSEIWGRSCEGLYADQGAWFESVHPEDRERVNQARSANYAGGRYDETFRIQRPDNSVRWIHSRAFPVRAADGKVSRVVGISEDITKYRALEEQFRQAQKMEAVGTLAGGIAHDFNNILAAINGYTELSQMQLKENPVVRSYLSAVLKASSRAGDLIRQILMFSRQQPLERKPIRLHSIVVECLALLRATLPSTIVFNTSLAIDAPTVLADATQVHQLLMNLGTNAWHAMKDASGKLEVKLEKFEVDEAIAASHPRLHCGSYARLSFADTGVGMDRATLGRIFEPFFTTKPLGEGTGIGLAVVHGIMESHGGLITVYSQPGEGTQFHLYFPAYSGDDPATVAAAAALPRGHGERILFVDDEESLALLGRDSLTALGYEVEFTVQPSAALEMVRANPSRFALVLTDQTMPGMTGLTLASQLRELCPDLPVLLTSGYSLSLTPARLAAAGVRQLLPKPTSLHALATALQECLGVRPPP